MRFVEVNNYMWTNHTGPCLQCLHVGFGVRAGPKEAGIPSHVKSAAHDDCSKISNCACRRICDPGDECRLMICPRAMFAAAASLRRSRW